VFGVAKDGTGYSVIYHFTGTAYDGGAPWSGLCQGNDGLLYGTTPSVTGINEGTVYRLAPDGSKHAVLKVFISTPIEGYSPLVAGVIEKDGVLYGTTAKGGTFDEGVVYALNVDGTGYETLVNFGAGFDDGWSPTGLILGSDLNLYGTTYSGAGGGTIFRCRTR
jgi:uncharacterized repeat protein (TIGR03803 family)